MLHNETYAGVWYYGKYKKVDGKRVQNPPPSTWLAVEVPSIVDRQTWEKAQVIMKENHNNAKRNKVSVSLATACCLQRVRHTDERR
jgi:hypothetical protein